jgi:hypothetical protein
LVRFTDLASLAKADAEGNLNDADRHHATMRNASAIARLNPHFLPPLGWMTHGTDLSHLAGNG